MFNQLLNTFFPTTKKEKTMANSTQYVVYTRNFRSRAKQIGVFAEPASAYKVNGEVHGGKIKFKNLAVKNTAVFFTARFLNLILPPCTSPFTL